MAQAKTLTQAEIDQVLRYVSKSRYAVRNRCLILTSFWSGMRVAEIANLKMRDVLNEACERRIAVLDPVALEITNYPDHTDEDCFAPNHPLKPELGKRNVKLSKHLWIEREDFMEVASPKFFRLYPGNMVRLRYGYVIKCTSFEKDENGIVSKIFCEYLADTKSGTPGSDSVKVKGNIHWISQAHTYKANIRLYEKLFNVEHPGSHDTNYLDQINPNSCITIEAALEKSLASSQPGEQFQFERHGYFVADLKDSKLNQPLFNRTVTLKDTSQK